MAVGEDWRDSETAEVDQWAGGGYGSVVVGSGCWGRARPLIRPVWPYLTPALTALCLGNQNPPKNHIWGYMGLYA